MVSTRSPEQQPRGSPRLGRYEIEGAIGKGAMGSVYKARDARLGRSVALKLLGTRQSPQALARFEREARVVASLRHPGIVTLLDAGEEGGIPFLVMELVEGEPLAAAIRRGDLAPRDAAKIVRDVATALGHAHAAGIVHRDVTPGNILLEKDGRARLSDFGVAKDERLEGDETRLSKTGALIGTPHYMSPEQLAGQKATPLSDVYALGVVLYEALTRTFPHQAESVLELMGVILDRMPDSPRARNPDVPEELSAICMKALAREPKDRYESAQAFADDLTRALEGARGGLFSGGAFKNRGRSALALLALAGATASIVVLASIDLGARNVVRSIFEKTPGILVMKYNSLPQFSRLPPRSRRRSARSRASRASTPRSGRSPTTSKGGRRSSAR